MALPSFLTGSTGPAPPLALPSLRTALIAGILAYLAALILGAPATLTARLVARASAGQVILEGVEGSFWAGQAQRLSIRVSPERTLTLTGLHWRFRPWSLLRAEAAADLELDGREAFGHGTVAMSPGTLRVRDLDLGASATPLAGTVPVLAFVRPGGMLKLQSEELRWAGGVLEGRGTLEWRRASARSAPVNPLGDYRAAFTGNDAGIQYQVTTLNGPLHLEGRGNWVRNGSRSYTGTARADPPADALLAGVLRSLGREQSPGVYEISLR